ncbi:uncharacterized protein LOC131670553 [Phymastichus coffea]|uniref:uncharacterized protein LOC131670553 n=1 Tax=Phymastichus coffea TaxID=108790 RepID=UPI00273AAD8E|nr:uncharacterized protein LOC131670553 [Phymastichus coffea]
MAPRLLSTVGSWRSDERLLWSWCGKKRDKSTAATTTTTAATAASCKSDNVFRESNCRRRLPQCPEHIDTGDPSKCCEQGYGKPVKVKKTWWTNVRASPPMVKQKPSNCDPPPCPKEETFMEYIFGPEKPLPEPNSCRRAWKIKQSCNYEDPRLEDPRYQATAGDVLLYTEPDKRKSRLPTEPQPKAPSPYKAPAGVICKKLRDSVAATALECYCACADPCLFQDWPQTNLCPVHSKPFKFPYEEMKPVNRRKKFFTGSQGVAAEDIVLPPRRESCSCVHSAFVEKSRGLLPDREICDLHDDLQRRGQLLRRNEFEGPDRKMSKCERLRQITRAKEKQTSELAVPRRRPLPCESKCKGLADQN